MLDQNQMLKLSHLLVLDRVTYNLSCLLCKILSLTLLNYNTNFYSGAGGMKQGIRIGRLPK